MSKSALLLPLMSEKSYALSKMHNVYTFKVPLDANVSEIASAVSLQYSVTVSDVRVLRQKGKVVRTVRKTIRPGYGKRSDYKKAYVTLVAGQTIPIFAAIDEAAEEQQKAADKAAKKEKKAKVA